MDVAGLGLLDLSDAMPQLLVEAMSTQSTPLSAAPIAAATACAAGAGGGAAHGAAPPPPRSPRQAACEARAQRRATKAPARLGARVGIEPDEHSASTRRPSSDVDEAKSLSRNSGGPPHVARPARASSDAKSSPDRSVRPSHERAAAAASGGAEGLIAPARRAFARAMFGEAAARPRRWTGSDSTPRTVIQRPTLTDLEASSLRSRSDSVPQLPFARSPSPTDGRLSPRAAAADAAADELERGPPPAATDDLGGGGGRRRSPDGRGERRFIKRASDHAHAPDTQLPSERSGDHSFRASMLNRSQAPSGANTSKLGRSRTSSGADAAANAEGREGSGAMLSSAAALCRQTPEQAEEAYLDKLLAETAPNAHAPSSGRAPRRASAALPTGSAANQAGARLALSGGWTANLSALESFAEGIISLGAGKLPAPSGANRVAPPPPQAKPPIAGPAKPPLALPLSRSDGVL
jgi:hypothetical protein